MRTSYALQGIYYFLSRDKSSIIHFILLFSIITLGVFLHFEHWEWIILVLLNMLTLALEMVNSAIEVIVDFISPHYHAKAKIIKDVAAGAVLVTGMTQIICLFLILSSII